MRPKGFMAAGVLALLGGCGGPLSIYVKGIKPLNENDRTESTPVIIRIYQLRDDARFIQAPLDNLWMKAKETLAGDAAADKEETVHPGIPEDVPREIPLGVLPEGVRFIGILALFPKEDDEGPRRIVVPAGEAGKGVFEFTGYHVSWKR